MYKIEKKERIKKEHLSIIAHRGASTEAPENTLASIKLALKYKVDWVEIDVRLSQDAIPIVLHDHSPIRVSGIQDLPPIHMLKLKEIRQLDVGQQFSTSYRGEKIPTLEEVLNLEWNDSGLMIEIKECHQSSKEVVEAVFNVINEAKKPLPSLLVGSFSIKTLSEIDQYISSSQNNIKKIGILEDLGMIRPFLSKKITHFAIWHRLATPKLIKFLESKKIHIWAFTVDDMDIAKSLTAKNIKGIISNVPLKMIEIYSSNSKKRKE